MYQNYESIPESQRVSEILEFLWTSNSEEEVCWWTEKSSK